MFDADALFSSAGGYGGAAGTLSTGALTGGFGPGGFGAGEVKL